MGPPVTGLTMRCYAEVKLHRNAVKLFELAMARRRRYTIFVMTFLTRPYLRSVGHQYLARKPHVCQAVESTVRAGSSFQSQTHGLWAVK
jgi:hypothetical protein